MAGIVMPTLVVEVALSKGPNDTVSGGDWTDLSERVRLDAGGLSLRRGRNDQTAEFDAGTIDIALDNTDRMLDPANPSGLVASPDGLPLCPVRVRLYDGTDYWPLFRGWLGPECWAADDAPHGAESTVHLLAFDEVARAGLVSLPTSRWALLTQWLDPDWWITGDVGFPILGNGEEIPNSSGSGGGALVVASGGDGMYAGLSIVPGVDDPSMLPDVGVSMKSPAAHVMPDGDKTNFTAMVWWRSSVEASTTQPIMTAKSTGGTSRWRVALNPVDGTMDLDLYDSGGTLFNTVTVASTSSPGARWDDGSSHLVMVRIRGGVESTLNVDGIEESATVAPLDKVRTSDIILGPPADDPATWDELLVWRRALADLELAAFVLFAGVGTGPFGQDTFTERLTHWFQAAKAGPTAADIVEWHDDPSSPPHTLWPVDSVPNTFGQALTSAARDEGGVVWATKAGPLRIRTLAALSALAYADDYADPAIHLTDEPSPALSPSPGRRGQVTFTGVREDRIVNETIVSFGVPDSLYGTRTYRQIRMRNDGSIARYGLRSESISTEVKDWQFAGYLAALNVFRKSVPTNEIKSVRITPVGSESQPTLDWLVRYCELERPVKVTHTRPVGPPYVATLNVQSEKWDWNDRGLVVELNLAQS